jgi:hypothetical protein
MKNNFFCDECTERHCNNCQIDVIEKNKSPQNRSNKHLYSSVLAVCHICGHMKNVYNSIIKEHGQDILYCKVCKSYRIFNRYDL